ncbi:hypothetical protein LIV57_18085 [Chryseobacterium sp. X308]|uniref:hypothetical protein n=1 Tax=Chryseobacterium sp. X308 TaxID=2884873 RepID=UPI001D142AF3|nr:hypothetical protein [Chryseobacterium sp. X308]MCC3217182.1 hypothetical protein [Chryseobacterium sp. X308]
MKKKFLLLGGLTISLQVFSQVGINTPDPQASLDVVGKPTSTNVFDGIIAPRITGAQLRAKTYTQKQQGAMVYVTAADTAPGGQTAEVTSTGYFYFDSNLNRWQKLNSGTIAVGDPTTDAFIDDPANTMVKLGASSNGTARSSNTDFVIKDNGRVGIGTASPDTALHIKENGNPDSNQLKVQAINNSPLINLERTGTNNLTAGTELGKLSFNGKIFGANYPLAGIKANYWGDGSTNSSALTFSTSDRPAAVINENGNMGIGRYDTNYAMSPTQKLDVDGNVRFRGVPSSTMSSTDMLMALDTNGVAKKVDITTPASVLVATRTGPSVKSGDGSENILWFENTRLSNNAYLTRVDNGTFQANKAGLYTISITAYFDQVPEGTALESHYRGVTVGVSTTGGKRTQHYGSNYLGQGFTNITAVFILNAGEQFHAYSQCNKGGSYRQMGATMSVVYTPL